MKQIIQSFKTGDTLLEDVPVPIVSKGNVLIKSTYSLVSLGTERMLVEFGRSNLISKARQQPDKVKEVLNKVKTDGLKPTINAVFNKFGLSSLILIRHKIFIVGAYIFILTSSSYVSAVVYYTPFLLAHIKSFSFLTGFE